jgi:acyltransferase
MLFSAIKGTDLNNRIEWVDVSKGIGIILVVLGHIYLTGQGHKYIYSFHMPLFFFLSGYTFNLGKFKDIRQLLVKKFNSILIPYFWFSILTYTYWVIIERRVSGNSINPVSVFINIFVSQGSQSFLPHNPSLWFLTCLFIVGILFYLIAWNKKKINITLLLIICSISGYGISIYYPIRLPWSAAVALTGVVFYGTGFLVRGAKNNYSRSNYILLPVLGLCMVAGSIISALNRDVSMSENHFGNYFYFYTAAFLGIISVIIVSRLFGSCRILAYIGKNSLIIFGLHFPVKRLVMGLTCRALNMPLEQVKGSFLISSVDTVITILVLLPFIYLIRKHFKFIIGSIKKNSSSI